MSVIIKEVTSKKELKKFVKFNIELYKGNPYHVPGLIEEEMMTLDKRIRRLKSVTQSISWHTKTERLWDVSQG